MNELSSQDLIGHLVAKRPGRSRVFERWGLDYCCGGKKTLQAACEEKALDGSSTPKTARIPLLRHMGAGGHCSSALPMVRTGVTHFAWTIPLSDNHAHVEVSQTQCS